MVTPERVLVLLFGDVRYDSRVKRMITVAEAIGQVLLIDAAERAPHGEYSFRHVRVILGKKWSQSRRHLAFWQRVFWEAKSWQPDIVFAEESFTTLPGWIAARICGARLVYDAHELILPGSETQFSLRDRFWYLLERFVVRRAELVITANPERSELMFEHYRLPVLPTYMRNIAEPAVVTESALHEALTRYPALRRIEKDEILLLYQGFVSRERAVYRFVEVLDYLPRNYRMVVAGDGPDLERLIRSADRHRSSGRFVALGKVPGNELPAVTRAADIGIVTYSFIGLNNIYCAPNKLVEYAQAGIPVISSDQPPLTAMVGKFRIGETFCIKDGPKEMAAIIESIAGRLPLLRRNASVFSASLDPAAEVERIYSRVRALQLGQQLDESMSPPR